MSNAKNITQFQVPHDLEAPGQTMGFIEIPVDSLPAAAYPQIPGFLIERELGRGGMGVVYLAQQIAINRVVALKMVLAGDQIDPNDLTRFLHEAEAIGRLNHPNVVQIYECGFVDKLPYFALEYCAGGSLERLIRDVPQAPLLSAWVVEQLADALSVVHAQNIIHRDLKPENVLLQPLADSSRSSTSSERTNPLGFVPKLTDFGLARQGDLSLTQSGLIVGTPTYMAPEQARGENDQISPAADIWALGAILYRMLTGGVPFRSNNIPDTLMLVCNAEPVPIRQLVPNCPRDLETITHKCLQKEVNKRYVSAAALRDDLRAWREGRPILARPMSWSERSWKWACRHPLVTLLATIVLLGFFFTSGLAWWALQQKHLADVKTTEAQLNENQARLNARLAEKHFEVAKKERNLSRDALDTLTDDFIREHLEIATKLSDKDKAFLQKILSFYKQFSQQGENSPEARYNQALGLMKVASLQEWLGQPRDAKKNCELAHEIMSLLNAQFPEELAYRKELVVAKMTLSKLLLKGGDPQKAEEYVSDAISIQKALIAAAPEELSYRQQLAHLHNTLGVTFGNRSRYAEAKNQYLQAKKIQSELRMLYPTKVEYLEELANTFNNLGNVNNNLGEWSEGSEYFLQAREVQMRLVNEHPQTNRYRQALGRTRHNLAILYMKHRLYPQALLELLGSRELMNQLASANPSVTIYRQGLSRVLISLGKVYSQIGQPDLAEVEFTRAVQLLEVLMQEEPTVTTHGTILVPALLFIGERQTQRREWANAIHSFSRAIELLTNIVATSANEQAQESRRVAYGHRGEALLRVGRFSEAAEDFRLAGQTERALFAKLAIEPLSHKPRIVPE